MNIEENKIVKLFAEPSRNVHASQIQYLENDEVNNGICFHLGMPDPKTFPIQNFMDLIKDYPINWKDSFQYSPCAGLDSLRHAIISNLKQRDISVMLSNLVITDGISESFDLFPQIFIDPGDVIFVESPTYPWALRAFKLYRAQIIELKVENDGIDILELEKKIQEFKDKAKLIYLIPNYHNPTGAFMSLEKRKQVIRIAKKYGLIILEDDPYYHLSYDLKILPNLYELDKNIVVYMSTFSKTIGGGIRLGWVLANEVIIKKIISIKHTGTNPFASDIVANYILHSDFKKNIENIRQLYLLKSEIVMKLLKANHLDNYLFTEPKGGFYIWMKIPDINQQEEFYNACTKNKVFIMQGKEFSFNPLMQEHYRISFSYESIENIIKGIKIIAGIYNDI